jgi:two-component system, NtrC family, sensor histidine kinase KinB
VTGDVKENEIARTSLELLYEVGREVASALDLHTVLHRVLFLSMKTVGAIRGSIIVIDEMGIPVDSAFLMAGQSHDQSALQLRMTYERGMAGWVAENQEAVLILDTSKDDRWLHRPDDAEGRTGPKSAVSAPIMAREKIVGVITLVHPQPGFFTLDHLELVKAIADQTGFAIRNARLYGSLQAAYKRYQELFEHSIDPILISDLKGKIVEVNRQAKLTIGGGYEKIVQMNIRDLHDVDYSKLGVDFENLSAGKTFTYESMLFAFDRKEIPIQVSVCSIQDGSEIQLQWILRDITERKDLDHLREDFITMVYHDLRSPLANIVSSLEVLSNVLPVEKDETIASLLTIASRSTDRIQRLTNSLLDINQLEAGQAIGNRQPVAPRGLIKEAVDIVKPQSIIRGLRLTWAAAADLPNIFADADMIRRVLINLLENAIKFTPAKGKIRVSARKKDEQVEITVSDTGSGISSADSERIFEKFTRLSPKEGPRGLGLGLAYCRLAVLGHGGEIWVESKPGKGAKFKFTIPIAR